MHTYTWFLRLYQSWYSNRTMLSRTCLARRATLEFSVLFRVVSSFSIDCRSSVSPGSRSHRWSCGHMPMLNTYYHSMHLINLAALTQMSCRVNLTIKATHGLQNVVFILRWSYIKGLHVTVSSVGTDSSCHISQGGLKFEVVYCG